MPDVDQTGNLARFLAESRWEAVPERVRHEGRRTILNCLGTALGGCRDEQVEHALAVLRPFSGAPEAALIGRGERLDALSAAFINAAAANLHDFDDTHMQTIIHSAAPVVPGALALGERMHASGAQLLHAVILGVEAECRVGNAVSPWHYAHGWHITSTCGAVGAAAAAGKLLGLDAPRMTAALALGATQACGLLDSLGFMAKGVSVGNAPRSGIVAALLAERGFTAGPRTLDGKYGFVNVLGDKPDAGALTRGLGEEWEAAKIAFKPYPCGIVLHPVLDALLELRAKHALKAGDIERVTVRAHSLLQQRTDRPRPRLGREAQVSLQHAAAMCFLHGAAGLRQFTDAMAADPAAQAFGDRISIENDDSMAVEAANVVLRTVDGRTLTLDVAHALGSLANPMSDAQIEAKVRGCAAFGAPGYDVAPLIDAVWKLEELKDAAALAALLPEFMTPPPLLHGKCALVTGSNDGLGYAIAEGLARAGCDVVLHGLEAESSLRARCEELAGAHGIRASYVCSDLATDSGARRLADAARELGEIGILVNNAVVRHFSPVADFPIDAWQRALAVNLTAPLQLVQLLLPGMRKSGWGRIVNLSSAYGSRAAANRIDYVTTKSALLGFTRAIALETGGQGITCNSVCPGTVLTPGIEARVAQIVAGGVPRAEAERQFLAGKQPTGRFVEADDVAQLIVFLCGPAGRDITGAMLPVDGGWMAG